MLPDQLDFLQSKYSQKYNIQVIPKAVLLVHFIDIIVLNYLINIKYLLHLVFIFVNSIDFLDKELALIFDKLERAFEFKRGIY